MALFKGNFHPFFVPITGHNRRGDFHDARQNTPKCHHPENSALWGMSAAKQNGIARGYAVFEYQLSQHRTHCAFLLGKSPLLFPNQVQNIACQVEGACHHEQCTLMALSLIHI